MSITSTTHLVLIPSYNPGALVINTVRAACLQWSPVWVVVDGSTDDSLEKLQFFATTEPSLRLIVLPENKGKGAAILEGIRQAAQNGFTHVLTMDSDGQHPTDLIPLFMHTSQRELACMVLGKPVFSTDAPRLRVNGRKISNWWTHLETLWMGVGDSLYGFRVYPIAPLQRIMQGQKWMRRFDFDPEAAVRLCWAGVPPININAPVRYFTADEGGVSHFNYIRDNLLLSWMHTRLFCDFIVRLPNFLLNRNKYLMKSSSKKVD